MDIFYKYILFYSSQIALYKTNNIILCLINMFLLINELIKLIPFQVNNVQ